MFDPHSLRLPDSGERVPVLEEGETHMQIKLRYLEDDPPSFCFSTLGLDPILDRANMSIDEGKDLPHTQLQVKPHHL